MNIVTAKNLTKYYNSLHAVDGIDFEIKEGECFGFLGPNGAGKTTVMSIVYCFLPLTSGEVNVFGMDVTKSPGEIKARLGVMPQDDNLDLELSVIENLIVYARYFNIMKDKSIDLARNLLEFVELSEKADVNIRSTTLILTTHYMEEAEQLCDRVAIMDSGKIITIDTPSQLMSIHKGNLEDVYLKLTGKNLEARKEIIGK